MFNNIYNKFFKQIKRNARVCIYGTGNASLRIKRELEHRRPDVKIVFFINSSAEGEFLGLPLHKVSDVKRYLEEFDQVIISSWSHRVQMQVFLNIFGVEDSKIINVPVDFLKQEKFEKLVENQKIFFTNEDKKLYKLIFKEMTDSTKIKLLEKYLCKKLDKDTVYKAARHHYFDYINPDTIKTVLDCGFYNGETSILFLKRFSNLEKIYAFEPCYEKFKIEIYDEAIKKCPKIELSSTCVWDTKTKLQFELRKDWAQSSSIAGIKGCINEEKYDILEVNAVKIDDFVKEKNIDKVDFIKMDLENAEMQALKGAEQTLLTHRPQLAISIYHSFEQFVEIPVYLYKLLPDYIFRLGQYSYSRYETVLYAIPKELYRP